MSKSPRQANANSAPKKITYTGGSACCGPMASGRASPTNKKKPVLCNEKSHGY